MAVETVTNYTCDRCGRSEIKDGVKILTLTVRARAGANKPGQGASEYSAHVCSENCLKMIKAAMTPVGRPGHYDRKAAAAKRSQTKINKSPAKLGTKRSTKNGSTARTRVKAATPVPAHQTAPETAGETRADVVKAVRRITRTPNGGWAKGHNYRTERAMIAEREKITNK